MSPQATTSPTQTRPNRRSFVLGAVGACAAVGVGGWRMPGSSGSANWKLSRRSSHALGSTVTISAWHREEAEDGEAALDAAFAELDLIESLMSLYRPDSQLSELNKTAVLHRPHPYLVKVLKHASRMSEQSGGAFDITVQPLWTLYAEAQKRGRVPTEAEVHRARSLVDWQRVQVTAEGIRLSGEGTTITLNGIAQGFAADAVMTVLKRAGVEHALIDTGEVGTLGGKPAGEPWRIGIQHPRQPGGYASLVDLQDRCLATSGDYETRFSDNYVAHHLFDPRTGHSPPELASVSIIAPTAMAADALSTAVFVLGAERGLDLVRRSPQTDALLITKQGEMHRTGGFPAVA